MFPLRVFSSLLILSGGLLGAAEKDAGGVPVLLELFTSEGCSSCPAADQLLEALDQKQPIAGAHLIVLSEHVDYWDRLGWKDPFSSPEYTARQRDYTNRYHFDGVYTPQLVVDGRFGFVGSDKGEASSAIRKAIRQRKIGIAISHVERSGNEVKARIELPEGPNFKGVEGVLYVAIADNRQESHVVRGENAGRSLAHVAVTRALKQVGTVDLAGGSTTDITLPVKDDANGSRIVAFVQDRKSGRVIGVADQKL